MVKFSVISVLNDVHQAYYFSRTRVNRIIYGFWRSLFFRFNVFINLKRFYQLYGQTKEFFKKVFEQSCGGLKII